MKRSYSVKKMDRAKEKEWREKRRHRKKEKLIKVCITTLKAVAPLGFRIDGFPNADSKS